MASDQITHSFVQSSLEKQDVDQTTLPGKQAQLLDCPCGEKAFLKASLKSLSSYTLHLLSVFLLPGPSGYFEILAALRVPQCCFFSRWNQTISLSLCTQDKCFSPLGSSCWAAYRSSVPFLLGGWGGQDWMQKSRCDLPPINLLAEQLLIHLRMLLVFLAARAHSSVHKDFLLPRTLLVLFIVNDVYFCNSLKHTFL